MDAWEEKIKLPGVFEGEMVAEALKLEQPTLRAELLGWLKTKMPEDGTVKGLVKDDVLACIIYLYACLEDRSPDVRKNAQEVFLNFMVQVGPEAMMRVTGRVKPASKNGLVALIEKYRPMLPAKPAPPPAPVAEVKAVRGGGGRAPKPASSPVKAAPETSPDPDDEEFDEIPARGAVAAKGATAKGGAAAAKPAVRARVSFSKSIRILFSSFHTCGGTNANTSAA